MGWLIDVEDLHEFTIENDDGDKAQVKIRRMAEGDYQDRQNLVARLKVQSRDDDDEDEGSNDMSYMIGEVRKFDIRTCVVSWDLPFDPTNQVIESLDPSVAEQIHNEIAKKNPFVFGERKKKDRNLARELEQASNGEVPKEESTTVEAITSTS